MQSPLEQSIEIGDLASITTYRAGAIQSAAHRALKRYCDEILSPYSINKTEWLVIGLALDASPGGISMKNLAKQLGATQGHLTRMVNSLVRKRKICRIDCEDDGRSKLITVHPDFESDCIEIESSLRTGLREAVYQHISPIEFRVYLKVLYQLSQLEE